MEAALYYDLVNTALISAIVDSRVYPIIAEQGAQLPYITYQLIFAGYERHTGGGTDLARAVIQIDCWAETHKEVRDLAVAVQNRYDNFTGTLGGDGNTAEIDSCFLKDDRDEFVPAREATGRGIYRRSLDLEFWYRE